MTILKSTSSQKKRTKTPPIKPTNSKKSADKKIPKKVIQLNESKLKHFKEQLVEVSSHQQKPKRRLRKRNNRIRESSSQNDYVPKLQEMSENDDASALQNLQQNINDVQKMDIQEQNNVNQKKGKKNSKKKIFKIQDDKDILKQKQEEQKKKKTKKLKGNQEIDKVMKNLNKNPKKIDKSIKKCKQSEISQTNLHYFFQMKKKIEEQNLKSEIQCQKQRKQHELQSTIGKNGDASDSSSNSQDQLNYLKARQLYYNNQGSIKKDQVDHNIQSGKEKQIQMQIIPEKEAILIQVQQQKSSKPQKIQRSSINQNLKQKNQHYGLSLDDFAHNQSVDQLQAKRQSDAQLSEEEFMKIQKFNNYSTTKKTKSDMIDQKNQCMQLKSKTQPKSEKKQQRTSKSEKKQNNVKTSQNTGPLRDQVILFTGQFQLYSKNQISQLCQRLGGTICKSVTAKTSVLFQGDYCVSNYGKRIQQDINTTQKYTKALQKGIKIITSSKLNQFFFEKTGKTLEEHFTIDLKKLDEFVKNCDEQKLENQRLPSGQIQQYPQKTQVQIPAQQKIDFQIKSAQYHKLWTQKYKPQKLSDVIGQTKQIESLKQWLKDWQEVVLRGNKKDVAPHKGFLPSGNMNSRAALLSGDPGLGKTTTARLLAQELNYSITEFNASDIRNKKGLQLLETNSFGLLKTSNLVKNVVIMDEVDGMSKGDRGGITQIIQMIKNTSTPIICICNDRQSDKIRSLAGHCLDIKFHKPDKRLIVRRLQQILKKQNGFASDVVLTNTVQMFQNDMRQILTYLELIFKTKTSQINATSMKNHNINGFKKDNAVLMTHFEATSKLLNKQSLCSMSQRDKLDCYFIDSDMVSINVFENYLSSCSKRFSSLMSQQSKRSINHTKDKAANSGPSKTYLSEFRKLVKATEGFVQGDLIESKIRKEQEWGLMPSAGYMLAVYPAEMIADSLGFPQFPGWLGKFSSERKQKRLLKQLKSYLHTSNNPTTSKATRFAYAPIIYHEINFLLKKEKIEQVLELMEQYGLTPTVLNEHLLQLQFNSMKATLLNDVSSAIKSRLTKAYNKKHQETKLKKITKGIKKGTSASGMQKFNPLMQEYQDENNLNNDDDSEQQNNNSTANRKNNTGIKHSNPPNNKQIANKKINKPAKNKNKYAYSSQSEDDYN